MILLYIFCLKKIKVSKQPQMREQIKQVDWRVKMRTKISAFELEMDSGLFAARRERVWVAADGRGRSAALALPARHAASTADVYVFTVGLFYRGLSKDVFS